MFVRLFRGSLFLGLALAATGCGKSAPAAVVQAEPATRASMTAEAFFAECIADSAEAAKKFAGGSVEVAGVVQSIEATLSGESFVSLGVPESPAGVVCYTKDKNLRGRLIPGQTVKLRGKYPETQEGVTLVECVVVEMGEHGAIVRTAETLADEFGSDKLARERLADRYMVVTGVISGRTGGDENEPIHLVLAGGKGVRIDCGFSPFDRGGSQDLKPGRTVRVVGKFWADETSDECICLRMCSIAADEL